MIDLQHSLTSDIASCTAISIVPPATDIQALLDAMITAKPSYTSQSTTPQIRITVLYYHEKVFVAIIFLREETADKDFIEDIF